MKSSLGIDQSLITAANMEKNRCCGRHTQCRLLFVELIAGMLLALATVGIDAKDNSFNKTKWNFDGSLQTAGGYESNLFRRPDYMDTGSGRFSTVESDALFFTALNGRAAFIPSKEHKFQAGLQGDYTLFPQHTSSNESMIESMIEYRFKPDSRFNLRMSGDVGHFERLAVDESSDGAADLYRYWQYEGGVAAESEPLNWLEIDASYLWSNKDYAEKDTSQSLDNFQHEMVLGIGPHFGKDGKQSLMLEGSVMLKRYQELGSYDANGLKLDMYPVRRYNYYSVALIYKNDFGPVVLTLAERPRNRIDLFRDFYTYFENRLYLRVQTNLSKRMKLDIETAWRYRKYKVHEAAQPGVNPKLIMQYIDAGAHFTRKLTKHLCISADYTTTIRLTNTKRPSFHSYRNYYDHVLNAGIRYDW
jgi:hypothetical protein